MSFIKVTDKNDEIWFVDKKYISGFVEDDDAHDTYRDDKNDKPTKTLIFFIENCNLPRELQVQEDIMDIHNQIGKDNE